MRHLLGLALSAAFALSLLAGSAKADGITIGAFCIEGVKSKEVPGTRQALPDGYTFATDYTYSVPNGAPSLADIVIFSKTVNLDPLTLPSCANAKQAAVAQGATIVLEAKLRDLRVRLHHFVRNGSQNSFVIGKDEFDATLGKVTSGFSTIAGGVMNLSGSQAWVANKTDELKIFAGGMSGTLRIESWDRTLENAVFETASGQTFKQTLRASPEGNTYLDLDTATGVASLWKANLRAANVSLPAMRVDGQVASFDNATLQLQRLALRAEAGRRSVLFEGATGQATMGKLGSGLLQATLAKTSLKWNLASAPATADQTKVKLDKFDFHILSLQTDTAKIDYSGATMLSGAAKAQFAELGLEAVQGSVDLTAPQTPALAFALPAGSVPTAKLTLAGTPEKLTVSGALNTTKLAVGNMAFTANAPLTFTKAPADLEVRIPIDIHVAPASGGFEVKDGQNTVALTAALKRLDLTGDLFVDVVDVAQSRLEIPQDKLQFEIATAVSVTAYLAGSRPVLAQAGVKASNPQKLAIRQAGSTGLIDILTPTLVMGDPTLDIGEKGKAAKVTFALKAEASATLRYDLATSSTSLVEGSFLLTNAHIFSPDGSFTADLGGALISRPDVQLQRLSLVFKKSEGAGRITGENLAFNGAGVRSAGKDGVAYRGAITAPLKVEAIDGRVVIDDKKVGLFDLTLKKFSFAVKADKVAFDGSTQLKNASLSLSADEIRSVSGQAAEAEPANGTYFTNLRVRAEGALDIGGNVSLVNDPRISDLNVLLNGRSDALDGSGSARLDGFAGAVESALDTGFDCSSGQKLGVPVRAVLATGPSDLTIEAKAGKIKTTGSFAGFVADVHSTAAKACQSGPKTYKKDAVWGSMTGWCPTWNNPGRTCEWKTILVPEINIDYRIKVSVALLHAGVAMTNPKVAMTEGGVSVCNVGTVSLIAPVIVGSYVPQLDDNGVIAQAINVLVEGVAVSVESTVATGLLTAASTLIQDPLVNIYGSANCIVKGEYREF